MQRALGTVRRQPLTEQEASMAEAFADPDRIEGYHAHIYYDPATRATAERMREGIGARFETAARQLA